MAGRTLPFALPPLEAVLLRRHGAAVAALVDAGWKPYATPITMDAERRRLLNVDLTEPEVAWHAGDEIAAVAHVEADRAGDVTHLEITAAAAVAPETLADALLGSPGAPKLGGGVEAREWIWGPEAGSGGMVGGVPVRLWVCLERAYGDRLWAIASLVRRG
ncbi:MAG: hypothetical protein ACJ79R_11155 [Anaeromyxobacteraceae bacterium]